MVSAALILLAAIFSHFPLTQTFPNSQIRKAIDDCCSVFAPSMMYQRIDGRTVDHRP